MFFFLSRTKPTKYNPSVRVSDVKTLMGNVQKQTRATLLPIFLGDLLVICSQLVASQCLTHINSVLKIICISPVTQYAAFPLCETIIMLKPFVCDIGSPPGVRTSPSILQMLLKVNLVAKDAWFVRILENTSENFGNHFYICLQNVPKLFESSVRCLTQGTPHGQWLRLTLSCVFRSFRCLTFQGFHRTAEPSWQWLSPVGSHFQVLKLLS